MMGRALSEARRGRAVRAFAWCLALLLLAAGLRLLYGPAGVGYDARFSLIWGHELAQLDPPDYGAALSPTPHPLANLVGLAASLFGRRGPEVVAGLSFAWFAWLGLAAFAVGRRSFGIAA